MSPLIIASLGVLLLLILFILGMPVAYAMALVGVVGFSCMVSPSAGLAILARDFWSQFASYNLSVIPMFILMGSIAYYSGMGGRLYNTANKFLGHWKGGLAIATIAACAGFGALCGSTNAEAAAMSKVAFPEMRKYGYDDSLATACIASAGSLAILIPPSALLIVYGIITSESIGRLFLAGIVPGIFLTVLFIIAIALVCRINPALAPPGSRSTFKEKLASLKGVIEVLILFALVMGGIFLGWFTPTEGGAIGAAGALIIALVGRNFNLGLLFDSLSDTTRITGMVFLIITGAIIFGHFMSITGAPASLADWVSALGVPPAVTMFFIIIMYLIGGCFMDSLALVTLTVPTLLPLIMALGFDPVWFGIIIVLVGEAGVITPPVGINVYVVKSVVDVPLETIFRGILPFLAAIIVCIIFLIFFPQIVIFLPNLIMR
ncbi:MAG: TRAP transporter large permease [Syntrophomonadaceae bacterium]|nr:TRAP transporter large permease [Syntrophomonadaceae bacterium]